MLNRHTMGADVRAHARLLLGAGLVAAGLSLASVASAEAAPTTQTPAGQAALSRPQSLFTTLSSDISKPFRALSAVNSRDLECMSQAVYFEARGEPMAGQAAVAQVIMNRVRHPAFPKSVCGVVYQRAGHSCQFSWACRSPGSPGATGPWLQAKAIAARVLAGEAIARIGLATHFNGARAGGFGAGLQRVALIGHHAFYRFNGDKGSPAMFQPAVAVTASAAPAKPAPTLRPVYASLAVLPSPAAAGQFLSKAGAVVQAATAAAGSAAMNLVEQWRPELQPKPAPTFAVADPAAASPAAADRPTSPNDRVGDFKPAG